ncbi:MAG TPA: DMT family transporter [Candidatus Thermoplasmatota archaeon]
MESVAEQRAGRLAPAGLAVSALAISTSAPLVLASGADPLAIAAWRLLFMTAIVFTALAALGRAGSLRLPAQDAAMLLALGLVLGAHFGLWITSLKMTTVAASVVLVTSHPLMVAVLSHAMLKEKLTWATVTGVLVAFGGVVLLFAEDLADAGRLAGDVLALGGAAALGVYLIGGRAKRRAGLPVLAYTTYVYGGAAAGLMAAALAAGTHLHPLPTQEFVLFLVMALVPGMAGHTMYNWALRYIRATVVSVTHLLEPIGASLLVLWLFGQQPPAGTAVGAALTLLGILVVARSEARAQAAVERPGG